MTRRTAATVYSVIISDMNDLQDAFGFTQGAALNALARDRSEVRYGYRLEPSAAVVFDAPKPSKSERKAWENAPVSVRATWQALDSILLRGDTSSWYETDPVMDSAYELAWAHRRAMKKWKSQRGLD
tara:strand:+ start:5273 stop:5653 length:381 start_codon:yes stop_codon:yes gene_type:complete